MSVAVGSAAEQAEKARRVRSLLTHLNLSAVLLRRVSGFAWLTGGLDDHVNVASETGVASLLVTPERTYLFTTNIEAERLWREEGLRNAGYELVVNNWWQDPAPWSKLVSGPIGADGNYPGVQNISGELARLRYSLTGDEIERFRWLGRTTGGILQEVTAGLTPGLTEHEIAGRLAGPLLTQGIWPTVLLVATDERVYDYRHPIPIDKRLERYAMTVIGARRWGLCVSATRLVHIGPVPAELRRKSQATAVIDATFYTASRPGAHVADIFRRAQAAYAAAGYADEWTKHHQGGACGYEARDYRGLPDSNEVVVANQAFAWNPSISGAKGEDTIIVSDAGANGAGFEVISAAPGWPMQTATVDGQTVERPAILEK